MSTENEFRVGDRIIYEIVNHSWDDRTKIKETRKHYSAGVIKRMTKLTAYVVFDDKPHMKPHPCLLTKCKHEELNKGETK